MGSCLAISGYMSDNEIRIAVEEHFVGETKAIQLTGTEIFDNSIAMLYKIQNYRAGIWLFQIKSEAALVPPVDRPP